MNSNLINQPRNVRSFYREYVRNRIGFLKTAIEREEAKLKSRGSGASNRLAALYIHLKEEVDRLEASRGTTE